MPQARRSSASNSGAIPVIDVFAGPGGLNEGFSALLSASGNPVFRTLGSFEMDGPACSTLTLRATYRRLLAVGDLDTYQAIVRGDLAVPAVNDELSLDSMYGVNFSRAWQQSTAEVHRIELGSENDNSSILIARALAEAGVLKRGGRWVLVGGPPCQAYSLAGRSRRINDVNFEDDKKHFLYREYLKILAQFQPAVFIMENVKGLLSSTHSGEGMFHQIRSDLANPGGRVRYAVHSLIVDAPPEDLSPEDFIIRSESYGVPQKRHRVILLGLRQPDFDVREFQRLESMPGASVRDVIGAMPRIRSRVSRDTDSPEAWLAIRDRALTLTRGVLGGDVIGLKTKLGVPPLGDHWIDGSAPVKGDRRLMEWITGRGLVGVSQHEARRHMDADLVRYFYAAAFADRAKHSPNLSHFDEAGLLPNHASAHSDRRPFADRFRVQVWDSPSTTVVSHISKDGHYYIHPDPLQMRSLTLREAARLQTFPDDYFFVGNKTQQYVQVGNAVPPLLANQIAHVVAGIMDRCQSTT